jgi:hypothetical protein
MIGLRIPLTLHEVLEQTSEGSAYRALVNVSCALTHVASRDCAAASRHARDGHREMHALGMHALASVGLEQLEHMLHRVVSRSGEHAT